MKVMPLRMARVALITLLVLGSFIVMWFHRWREDYDNPPSPTFIIPNQHY